MTYSKNFEKIVAKDYAYPAVLFSVALLFSVIELFAVSIGGETFFMIYHRAALVALCAILLIVFAFARKNVNYFDVIATVILGLIAFADLMCILSTTPAFRYNDYYSPVVDVLPSGLMKIKMVVDVKPSVRITEEELVQLSAYKVSGFSFLGLCEGLFLAGIAATTVVRNNSTDGCKVVAVQKKVWAAVAAVFALLAIVFVIVLALK